MEYKREKKKINDIKRRRRWKEMRKKQREREKEGIKKKKMVRESILSSKNHFFKLPFLK